MQSAHLEEFQRPLSPRHFSIPDAVIERLENVVAFSRVSCECAPHMGAPEKTLTTAALDRMQVYVERVVERASDVLWEPVAATLTQPLVLPLALYAYAETSRAVVAANPQAENLNLMRRNLRAYQGTARDIYAAHRKENPENDYMRRTIRIARCSLALSQALTDAASQGTPSRPMGHAVNAPGREPLT